jgi:hypothetical protein
LRTDSAQFLRRALLADGVVSGLSGVMLVALSGPIAALLGVRSPGTVAVMGVALLVYAAALLCNARREMPRRGEAAIAVALNVAWVVASLAVVAAGWLSAAGNWAVGLVADVVLIFAILQAVGLRRMASEPASRPA